jgi:signal transduction histidine kinase
MLLALTVSADNLGFSEDNPLRFGLDVSYAPMQYINVNGDPQGFDVEFTEALMKRLKIPFKYYPNSWELVADDVLHGKTDLAMMVYSPYRKDMIGYSRAVFRLYYQMVYRKGENNHNGLRDVEGKTIAFMKSRPIADTLSKAGAKCVLVQDLKSTMVALASGQYDAVICFRYQARYIIEKYDLNNLVNIDLTLMPREYCYVSHNKELINRINEELDKMDAEGITEDIYGRIRTNFDRTVIPVWIWYLLAVMLVVGLILIIIMQKRHSKQLIREMERAKRSEELKDIFLNNLSHALRTPLNAIIGFSDLLLTTNRDPMTEEEQDHLLGLINSNGIQLLHLINELLSLSDIEGNTQLFERQVIDIDNEMEAYAAESRVQATDGVKVELVQPIGGLRALLDAKLLRLLTMHLMDNAVQHTTEGQVTLTYYAKEGGLYVEVKDTGHGLPETLKENIFALLSDKNTYVQEDTPGLGLSICKAVIDKAGGKIGAHDNEEDGRGTIVWYWAPVKILN